jgi:hypothetical protein
MLTAQEAANMTVEKNAADKQRAQIIWDNEIESRIKGQAANGETFLLYVFPLFEQKYGKYLLDIASSLNYQTTLNVDSIRIKWGHLMGGPSDITFNGGSKH